MLKNFKSEYFLKTIFSFIKERRKLDILAHNKSLQNQIEISIINYKLFSGRYIEFSSIGKGREFKADKNIILFEGEYANGKRNGKGIEYDEYSPDDIIFKGEYVNGVRHGKGIEYDLSGKIIFEGEYFKGARWNGKGYDGNLNVAYELNNGNGNIKEFIDGKLCFEC